MRLSHLLAISICGISTVACQVEEIDVPNEELFARSFIKEFGIADAQQDWNLATRVTANINPSAVAGAETISIYDRMPGSAGCQLAARFSATNTEFSFDFAKANLNRFVAVVFHWLFLDYNTGACVQNCYGHQCAVFREDLCHADFLSYNSLLHDCCTS